MEKDFRKSAGICLLAGSLLATITMVLHPMGGNIDHISKISQVLIFSHSTAILCMPFIGFGFWGMSILLQSRNRISMLSFFILCFGLLAAMIAATINGLVLPLFARKYSTIPVDSAIKSTILDYGRIINFSMTAIFIAAVGISITIWSVLIIQSGKFPKWFGYSGILLVTFGIAGLLMKFDFTDLAGFSIFVAGLVSWKIVGGLLLLKNAE